MIEIVIDGKKMTLPEAEKLYKELKVLFDKPLITYPWEPAPIKPYILEERFDGWWKDPVTYTV